MSETAYERYVESITFLRELFLDLDSFSEKELVSGIDEWDDSACIYFEDKGLVASMDGPYTKRLVMKSALIHASTDVIVKGARLLFALDSMIGSRKEVSEMAESLHNQAKALQVPILGGNTMLEEEKPRCSITVVGQLMDSFIPDSGAKKGDSILLLGEPIWGRQEERIEKANALFSAWYLVLSSNAVITSAKDVTKGGLVSTLKEMQEKSGNEFETVEKLPYHATRNLDNFLITASSEDVDLIKRICGQKGCPFHVLGEVD